EILVHAVGLNFRDVLSVVGGYPGLDDGGAIIGLECAGQITALGAGVEQFQVGDEVIAFAPGCFGSHALAAAELIVLKPPQMSFEEAASFLIAYATAYHALHHLGRLKSGERVLIHAAAGGVGLA